MPSAPASPGAWDGLARDPEGAEVLRLLNMPAGAETYADLHRMRSLIREYWRRPTQQQVDATVAAAAAGARQEGEAAGMERVAAKLEKQKDCHVHEHWSYDGSTNAWETRNRASEEWVMDREELIEEIRADAAAIRARGET